ncbi:PAS domain S-box protein [Desulfotruncus alcoholivorax]|uniref:PAS domain S-box protein n=1 Tax=Desulfotruncus alcoholivorax TaxID=265477 RepID=UPI00041D3AFE|nr:PAS domain S-box protein [Desulfotruncus alcoholivorax]
MNIDFRDTFYSSPLPIYVLQDGFFKLVNPMMAKISGYSVEELLDMPFEKLIYQEDRHYVVTTAMRRLAGENVSNEYEFRAVKRSGEIIYVRGYFSVIDYNGRPAVLGQVMDITELLKNEKKYKNILESIEDGYFEVDLSGNLTFFNDSLCEISGYTREEFIGMNFRQYTCEDYSKELYETFNKVYRLGEPVKLYNWKILRKDKTIRFVETSISLIRNTEGDKTGFRGIVRDVTEQKLMEEELGLQQAFFKKLFESSPEGILILDPADRIINANKGFENIFKFPVSEVIGQDVDDLLVPEGFEDQSSKLLDSALKGYVGQIETVRRRKDGVLIDVSILVYPIVVNGRTMGIYAIYSDITQRKRAEEELFKQKEQLAVTLNSIGDAVIAVDMLGRITLINPVAENLTGWSRQEAVGRHLDEVFLIINEYTREPVASPVDKVLTNGEIVGLANHTALIARDGSERSIADSAAPIRDANGKILGVILVFRDVTEERRLNEALRSSEERFRLLAEHAKDIIYRIKQYPEPVFEYISPAVKDILGYAPEEFYTNPYLGGKVFHRDDKEILKRTLTGKIDYSKTSVIRMVRKDGRVIWCEQHNVPIYDESKRLIAIEGISRDITERRKTEESLKEVVLGVSASVGVEFFRSLVYHLAKALEVDYAFVGELMAEEIGAKSVRTIAVYAWGEIVDNFRYLLAGTPCENVLENGTFYYPHGVREIFPDSEFIAQYGVDSYLGTPILNSNGKAVGLIAVMNSKPLKNHRLVESLLQIFSVRAATELERNKAEARMNYLSRHDQLTGLYNRSVFEHHMVQFEHEQYQPVGIIVCDVDGLKLVNDTMGHDKGDALLVAAAGVIKKSFRENDVIARIGGDEFAVLLPNTNEKQVEKACQRIRDAFARYNAENPELTLSISVGFAVGKGSTTLTDLFKKADNNMYREKLHRKQSTRSAIVQTLMKALEARDFITEGHADRLQDLVVRIAAAIGLSDQSIADLRLLAQFHDIGKVGIPDRILFKPGPLNEEERLEMRRHCEIGHRIALSAPDLVPIADWILKHHEWWNGKGYPLGLKEEEIPMECRILAIADAYDAMTSDRPYRKALSHNQAVVELRRCSRTQFDPALVASFIHIIENENNINAAAYEIR